MKCCAGRRRARRGRQRIARRGVGDRRSGARAMGQPRRRAGLRHARRRGHRRQRSRFHPSRRPATRRARDGECPVEGSRLPPRAACPQRRGLATRRDDRRTTRRRAPAQRARPDRAAAVGSRGRRGRAFPVADAELGVRHDPVDEHRRRHRVVGRVDAPPRARPGVARRAAVARPRRRARPRGRSRSH